MSFDSIEKSTYDARPYELFLFQGTGIQYSMTSGDEDVSYLGFIFTKASITRTEVEQSAEVTSGQITIDLDPSHPVAQMFIPYLPTSPVAVTVYGGHVGDGAYAVLFTGTVSSARFTPEGQCELLCNSENYALNRKILQQLYQAPCVHIFGDPDCGVDLGSVTYPGTVGAISADGFDVTVSAFGSLPHSLRAGFLRVGNILRMIVEHTGSTIKLLAPIASLQVGDAVSGTAGCQQTYAACQEYDNIANFLGFDLIPTLNPFDGSVT